MTAMRERAMSDRYRVGLLVPSSNTVMEPDLAAALAPAATVHTARMLLLDVTVEDEVRMLDEHTLPAAEALATLAPHVTVFGCTTAGALRGHAADAALAERISATTGAPTVSVIQAVRDALRGFGARRIAVATPYTHAMAASVVAGLDDVAEVVAVANLGLVANRAIGATPPERVAEFVVDRLAGAGADAIFVSCTNFRAVEALERIAGAAGVPVTSSNAAAIAAVRRHMERAGAAGGEAEAGARI
jgi:maleate isomerase